MPVKITAPIRIDFSALSDSPPFVDEYGGCTLNAAINHRVSTSIRGGIKISSKEDIPETGGLGSSAALRATDLAAQNPDLLETPLNLIRASWRYANENVNQRGGWQDECAAVYGGLNLWEYRRDKDTGQMEIKRTEIPREKANLLEKSLLLVSVGGPGMERRESSNIHDLVFGPENYEKNIEHLKAINEWTKKMAMCLIENESPLLYVPDFMNNVWTHLKALHPSIESKNMKILQEKYKGFFSAVKATGAGGDGSCMLFYPSCSGEKYRQELINKINECGIPGVGVIPFKFDYEGIKKEY